MSYAIAPAETEARVPMPDAAALSVDLSGARHDAERAGAMRFRRVGLADCAHVIENLRPADQTELEAALGPVTLDLHGAAIFHHACLTAWMANALVDAETEVPFAIWGVAPGAPGEECARGGAFLAGTRGFTLRRALAFADFVRRAAVPWLRGEGVRRVDLHALATNRPTLRWLQHCGARIECVCEGYGVGGEAFVQMAWT